MQNNSIPVNVPIAGRQTLSYCTKSEQIFFVCSDLRANALSSVPRDLSRYDLRFDVSGNRLQCDCQLSAVVANATDGQYFGEECVNEDEEDEDKDGEVEDLASKQIGRAAGREGVLWGGWVVGEGGPCETKKNTPGRRRSW